MSGLWECHGVHVWDWHWGGGGRKTKDWFPRHITELDAHIDRYQWELSICGSSSIIWGTKTLFVFINFCFLVLGWGSKKSFDKKITKVDPHIDSSQWDLSLCGSNVTIWWKTHYFFDPPPFPQCQSQTWLPWHSQRPDIQTFPGGPRGVPVPDATPQQVNFISPVLCALMNTSAS